MADADLFDSWFRIADRDRDGRISGLEAKEFMSRSNLSTDTLYKVGRLTKDYHPLRKALARLPG